MTFSATVSHVQGGPLQPSGTVTFSFCDANTLSQTVPLNGNSAEVTVSTLGVDDVFGHMVTAVYNGDNNYEDSKDELQQRVKPAAPGSISGIKFEDMNGDGILGSGDAGRGSWTIQLDSIDGGTVHQTTVTLLDGHGLSRRHAPRDDFLTRSVRTTVASSPYAADRYNHG